jgi:hypothetical protein
MKLAHITKEYLQQNTVTYLSQKTVDFLAGKMGKLNAQ